jgi:tetratricopeptide (TPR) repeat protein
MTRDGALETLLGQAAQLRRAGRNAEAEAAYERLLARWPDLPDSWYNLALLQRRSRRFEAALASYGQALDRGVAQPEEVHLNRAVILAEDLHQPDAAQRELEAALARNAAYQPAWLNLGNLHEDRGRRPEALAAYERLLAIAPGHAEGLARAAGLKAISGPDDPAVAALRQALARPGLSPADGASLGFALGKALDGCAAYDQAFAAYALANRFSRAGAPPGTARYDGAAQERYVDQLIAAFPAPVIAEPRPDGRAAPIFICGMFRSGSTLVEQVLASHRDVTAGGELDLLPAMIRARLSPYPAAVARAAPDTFEAMARAYLDEIARRLPGAALVTDKRPDNFLHIGLIKRMFPDARIINTVRDPLDNVLSCYFLHLDQGMAYALDLLDTGHYLRQQRRLMAHWRTLYPGDILDFDYDAFVAQPRPALEGLLAFLGLDWDEACLSFHQTDSAVRTASVWQVREPLYQRASGRWRNYERHLAELKSYLAP